MKKKRSRVRTQERYKGAKQTLFVAEGFNRVEGGRFPRRVIAEDDSDSCCESRCDQNCENRNLRRPLQQLRNSRRSSYARHDAAKAADRTQCKRFDQELAAHIVFGG